MFGNPVIAWSQPSSAYLFQTRVNEEHQGACDVQEFACGCCLRESVLNSLGGQKELVQFARSRSNLNVAFADGNEVAQKPRVYLRSGGGLMLCLLARTPGQIVELPDDPLGLQALTSTLGASTGRDGVFEV